MAATSVVRGLFVTAAHKQWDSFEDRRSGERVNAGSALTLFVLTPHDRDLCVIVPERKTQQGSEGAIFEDVMSRFAFGDPIEVETGALRGAKYVGIFSVNEPASAGSSSS